MLYGEENLKPSKRISIPELNFSGNPDDPLGPRLVDATFLDRDVIDSRFAGAVALGGVFDNRDRMRVATAFHESLGAVLCGDNEDEIAVAVSFDGSFHPNDVAQVNRTFLSAAKRSGFVQQQRVTTDVDGEIIKRQWLGRLVRKGHFPVGLALTVAETQFVGSLGSQGVDIPRRDHEAVRLVDAHLWTLYQVDRR